MKSNSTEQSAPALTNQNTDDHHNNKLPVELLIKCFSHLKLEDMFAVSLVCRTWSDAASHNYTWFSFYNKIRKPAKYDSRLEYKTFIKNMRIVPANMGTKVSDSIQKSCFDLNLDVSRSFSVVHFLRYENQLLLILEEIDTCFQNYVYYFRAYSFIPIDDGFALAFLSNQLATIMQTLHQSYKRKSFRVPCGILEQVQRQLHFKMNTKYVFDKDEDLVETLIQLFIKRCPVDTISEQIINGFVNIGPHANITSASSSHMIEVAIPAAPKNGMKP